MNSCSDDELYKSEACGRVADSSVNVMLPLEYGTICPTLQHTTTSRNIAAICKSDRFPTKPLQRILLTSVEDAILWFLVLNLLYERK